MTQVRLCSLPLMHIHYLEDINLEEVVDLFAKEYPRGLELGTVRNIMMISTADQHGFLQQTQRIIRILTFISIFVFLNSDIVL